MTWMPIEWARAHIPEPANPSASTIPVGLRVTGSVLRLVFIACLLAITVLVALPQNELIWTVYDTPGDLVRLALGFAVCIWVALQLFWAPRRRSELSDVGLLRTGGSSVLDHLPFRHLVSPF